MIIHAQTRILALLIVLGGSLLSPLCMGQEKQTGKAQPVDKLPSSIDVIEADADRQENIKRCNALIEEAYDRKLQSIDKLEPDTQPHEEVTVGMPASIAALGTGLIGIVLDASIKAIRSQGEKSRATYSANKNDYFYYGCYTQEGLKLLPRKLKMQFTRGQHNATGSPAAFQFVSELNSSEDQTRYELVPTELRFNQPLSKGFLRRGRDVGVTVLLRQPDGKDTPFATVPVLALKNIKKGAAFDRNQLPSHSQTSWFPPLPIEKEHLAKIEQGFKERLSSCTEKADTADAPCQALSQAYENEKAQCYRQTVLGPTTLADCHRMLEAKYGNDLRKCKKAALSTFRQCETRILQEAKEPGKLTGPFSIFITVEEKAKGGDFLLQAADLAGKNKDTVVKELSNVIFPQKKQTETKP